MEIRFSPFNAPFIPHNAEPGVYYIGREFRDLPHNAHVYEFQREQGRLHVERLQLEMTSAVALLPMLDEMANDGIKAASRRAIDIRKFLTPYKSTDKKPLRGPVLANRSIESQRRQQEL